MNKKTLKDIPAEALAGKNVLVRCDFNVPMEDGTITDDNRIRAALPTITYLLKAQARVILCSHMGRPKGQVNPSESLKPVAVRLGELIGQEVPLAPDCIGNAAAEIRGALQNGQCCLLENLRFHKAETKNDPAFAKELAEGADYYVNDAFGTAHRAHASTEGVTNYLPAFGGFLIEKELNFLAGALADPQKPLVAIVGGAKVGSKIGVLNKMAEIVGTDGAILIGGGMAYTFFKAQGLEIGNSLLDADNLDTAKKFLEKAQATGRKVLLPVDVVVADDFDNDANRQTVAFDAIPAEWEGMDIGPKTIEQFNEVIKNAGTVVWNGPVGVFEKENFAKGTFAVAEAVAACAGTTIIGGGDSAAAIDKAGVADQVSHISTGGGASLEFLEGRVLPGIAALQDK